MKNYYYKIFKIAAITGIILLSIDVSVPVKEARI